MEINALVQKIVKTLTLRGNTKSLFPYFYVSFFYLLVIPHVYPQGSNPAFYVVDALVEVQNNQAGPPTLNLVGDIEINGSSTMVNDSGTVWISGDWSNSGTFTSTGEERFIGTSGDQEITGIMSGSSYFHDLKLDKGGAGDIIIKADVDVKNTFEFVSDNKVKTENNIIHIQNDDSSAIINALTPGNYLPDARYFVTPNDMGANPNAGIRRDVVAGETYLFPVGNTNKGYNPIAFDVKQETGSGNYITVGYDDTVEGNIDYSFSAPMCGQGLPSNVWTHTIPDWSPGQLRTFELKTFLKDIGYWETNGSDNDMEYLLMLYPNANSTSLPVNAYVFRAVHTKDGVNWPWTADVTATTQAPINDNICMYSVAHTAIYDNTGVPGGIYKGWSKASIAGGFDPIFPVEFLDFTVASEDNKSAQLTWVVASEEQSQGYQIQRSLDGQNFDNMGWVDSQNTGQPSHAYSFNDPHLQAETLYYYRIKQVDIDGDFSFSEVRTVLLKLSDNLGIGALFPNPTNDQVSFTIYQHDAPDVRVRIFDLQGKQIGRELTFSLNNQTTMSFSVDHLPAGTYMIRIQKGGKIIKKKLTVIPE